MPTSRSTAPTSTGPTSTPGRSARANLDGSAREPALRHRPARTGWDSGRRRAPVLDRDRIGDDRPRQSRRDGRRRGAAHRARRAGGGRGRRQPHLLDEQQREHGRPRRAGRERADQAFIPTLAGPSGVAVNAPLGDAQAKGRQVQRGRRIRVRVEVTAGETLSASGGSDASKGEEVPAAAEDGRGCDARDQSADPAPAAQVRRRIARRMRSGKRTVAKLYVELNDGAGNGVSERLRVNLRR